MTTYLDNKAGLETPGTLSFSERIAQNWIKGKTSYTSRTVSSTYNATTTTTVELYVDDTVLDV